MSYYSWRQPSKFLFLITFFYFCISWTNMARSVCQSNLMVVLPWSKSLQSSSKCLQFKYGRCVCLQIFATHKTVYTLFYRASIVSEKKNKIHSFRRFYIILAFKVIAEVILFGQRVHWNISSWNVLFAIFFKHPM